MGFYSAGDFKVKIFSEKLGRLATGCLSSSDHQIFDEWPVDEHGASHIELKIALPLAAIVVVSLYARTLTKWSFSTT